MIIFDGAVDPAILGLSAEGIRRHVLAKGLFSCSGGDIVIAAGEDAAHRWGAVAPVRWGTSDGWLFAVPCRGLSGMTSAENLVTLRASLFPAILRKMILRPRDLPITATDPSGALRSCTGGDGGGEGDLDTWHWALAIAKHLDYRGDLRNVGLLLSAWSEVDRQRMIMERTTGTSRAPINLVGELRQDSAVPDPGWLSRPMRAMAELGYAAPRKVKRPRQHRTPWASSTYRHLAELLLGPTPDYARP